MSDTEYTPLTSLEAAVRNGMAGKGNEQDIIATLMQSKVFVPSASQCTAAGDNLTPLIVDGKRHPGPKIVVFDDTRHIPPEAARMAPYCLETESRWLVQAVAPGHGLILFIGPSMGCEISAEQVAEQREALAGQ